MLNSTLFRIAFLFALGNLSLTRGMAQVTYGNMPTTSIFTTIIYTSNTIGEHNRYLLLANSPQTTTASGLKAGGILCADSYKYANPDKNSLVVKGKLAVGYPILLLKPSPSMDRPIPVLATLAQMPAGKRMSPLSIMHWIQY